jgi:hypothetical protein
MNKDEVVVKLIELRAQEKELRKTLNQLEFKEKAEQAGQYVGKFYIETRQGSIMCVNVYGVDPKTANLLSLMVRYYDDREDSYFEIESISHFTPWDQDSQIFNWEETTKEEYLKHYNEVHRRIKKTLP